jgi:hypothetical protein
MGFILTILYDLMGFCGIYPFNIDMVEICIDGPLSSMNSLFKKKYLFIVMLILQRVVK